MDLSTVKGFVEKHPAASVAIGGVVVLGAMWLLGFFSSGKSSGGDSSGGGNLAAAYYAAEAQQAVVGGQIQLANIQATRDTAIAGLQTGAATDIAKSQVEGAVRINQQNTSTAQYIANSNNSTALTINRDTQNAMLTSDFFHTVLPTELLNNPGASQFFAPGGSFVVGAPQSPDQLRALGYSEQQISAMVH